MFQYSYKCALEMRWGVEVEEYPGTRVSRRRNFKMESFTSSDQEIKNHRRQGTRHSNHHRSIAPIACRVFLFVCSFLPEAALGPAPIFLSAVAYRSVTSALHGVKFSRRCCARM